MREFHRISGLPARKVEIVRIRRDTRPAGTNKLVRFNVRSTHFLLAVESSARGTSTVAARDPHLEKLWLWISLKTSPSSTRLRQPRRPFGPNSRWSFLHHRRL